MSADTTPGLAPCPWCGEVPDEALDVRGTAIECPSCGVSGPAGRDAAEAVEAWNSRAPAPAPQGPSMDDLTELVRSLGHNTWRQSAEIASAVLARWGAPAASGEPVAWLIQLSPATLGGQELTTLRDRAKLARHLGYSVTNLYAKPAQS